MTNNKLDENSEYVSTNLFDHKDLLSGMKLKVDQKPKNEQLADNSNIDYDSDIEIIEDYSSISSVKSSPAVKKEEVTWFRIVLQKYSNFNVKFLYMHLSFFFFLQKVEERGTKR